MIRSRLTELCQQAVESLPLAGASAVGEDKSGPAFGTIHGVAISGLIVAWPRESFLAFLATPFMW